MLLPSSMPQIWVTLHTNAKQCLEGGGGRGVNTVSKTKCLSRLIETTRYKDI